MSLINDALIRAREDDAQQNQSAARLQMAPEVVSHPKRPMVTMPIAMGLLLVGLLAASSWGVMRWMQGRSVPAVEPADLALLPIDTTRHIPAAETQIQATVPAAVVAAPAPQLAAPVNEPRPDPPPSILETVAESASQPFHPAMVNVMAEPPADAIASDPVASHWPAEPMAGATAPPAPPEPLDQGGQTRTDQPVIIATSNADDRAPQRANVSPTAMAAVPPKVKPLTLKRKSSRDTIDGKTYRQDLIHPDYPPLRLDGVVWSLTSPVALLNNSMVQPGDELDGFMILAIEKKRVKLARGKLAFYIRLP